jgi:hypothetical protein
MPCLTVREIIPFYPQQLVDLCQRRQLMLLRMRHNIDQAQDFTYDAGVIIIRSDVRDEPGRQPVNHGEEIWQRTTRFW